MIRRTLICAGIAVLGLVGQAAPDEEVLKSQQEAELRHLPAKDIKTGWGGHCVARGGTTIISHVTREYDMDGYQVGGSSFVNTSSHSGTVAAVPIGDFKPLTDFRYRGTSRTGGSAVLQGKLVSVSVQISTGNGRPAEMVMQRAVENMVKSGVPLPAATGAKPGKLLSLVECAKRRYGARIVKPRYDAAAGEVLLLLLDCLVEKADETYLPATQQGLSREQRQESVGALQKSADKGHFTIRATETEIIPVGGRRIPFNGAPAEIVP